MGEPSGIVCHEQPRPTDGRQRSPLVHAAASRREQIDDADRGANVTFSFLVPPVE